MPAPKPDTSPANVARVLRKYAGQLSGSDHSALAMSNAKRESYALDVLALADALEQQAAAPTWEERVRRAAIGGNVRYYEPCECDPNEPDFPCAYCTRNADAALRAAFPEIAP